MEVNTDTEEVPVTKSGILSMIQEKFGIDMIEPPALKQQLHDGFLLPIDYLDKTQVHTLSSTICEDLELDQMYTHLCRPTHEFSRELLKEVRRNYTSNVGFLSDTQKVMDRIPALGLKPVNTVKFREIWKDIKEDAHFLEKHSYMEWKIVEHLNQMPLFLQIYSMMNILSPIFSLVMPLLFLIVPFFILQIKGVPIEFSQYIDTMKELAKSHFIGKVLSIQNFNTETMLYFLFTAGLYFLQLYQNIHACIRYYHTVRRMNENLCELRDYLSNTVGNMDAFVKTYNTLPYYADFCQDVFSHKLVLEEICDNIGGLSRFCCYDYHKWFQLGHMLDLYYGLYSCIDYEESLRYSVGFEGYLDIVRGINANYLNGRIGKCDFERRNIQVKDDTSSDSESDVDTETDSKEDTVFVAQYYPPHAEQGVRNTCHLDKNMLITGVNASGKTTFLKTTAINVIFSQQFGVGFYASANLVPYQHIHSYLNIPDTSGRDSLFQAESRRCKEILDRIQETKTDRHFCIFDELYSGTNPKEAAKSAYSLLRYLSKRSGVRFVLTTHYVSVCKRFQKDKDCSTVANYKMDVQVLSDGAFRYTYRVKSGISKQEGGVVILKDMDYPKEIIDNITNPATA